MTLFEKIVAGEIPCYKIYEDADVFAFLDNNPHSIGHTLVIPKKPHENLSELPGDLLGPIMKVCQKIAIKAQDALGADGYNIVMNNGAVAGQEIFHAHFHVIPRYKGDTRPQIDRPHLGLSAEDFEEVRKKLVIVG